MSKTRLVLALSATLTLGALGLSAAPASAAPIMDPGVAAAADLAQTKPEAVRWVCNAWGRCWWRSGYRAYRPYGFYGPRRHYGRGWGHRRHWRRW